MPKLKSLIFYTIAIASVLVLFKIVTNYGENNLKAPVAISGRYRLTELENLSNCQKPDSLILNIQQSGMFLNGSLLSATNTKEISHTNENNLSLIGKLNNQQLTISGKVRKTILCNNPTQPSANKKSQPDDLNLFILQASLIPQGGFVGTITGNEISKPIKFSAIRDKSEEQPPNANSQPNKH
jgi:hypothetical protein